MAVTCDKDTLVYLNSVRYNGKAKMYCLQGYYIIYYKSTEIYNKYINNDYFLLRM